MDGKSNQELSRNRSDDTISLNLDHADANQGSKTPILRPFCCQFGDFGYSEREFWGKSLVTPAFVHFEIGIPDCPTHFN
jgi:hypothetical protein